MRLFFAAMLPPELQGPLSRLRENFAWLPIVASWNPAENIHITLKFLGEVPDAQVAPLSSHLRLDPSGPLRLQASHPVLFPPHGAVRVLGIGFDGDTQRLIDLQELIERYCQPMGFTREPRQYIPHATLARFRDGLHSKHRSRVEESIGNLAATSPFELTEIQLMQSELSPRGSRYTVVARYPL